MGASRDTWLGISLPVAIGSSGGNSCELRVSFDVALPTAIPVGKSSASWNLQTVLLWRR